MVDYFLLGFIAILAGMVIIFFASVASSRRTEETEQGETKVKGGGVIMIGPIPIIFGTDTRWVIVAIILAGILLLLGLVSYWR